MYDVSGQYPLQQSLVIGSYVKILVCEVLSDRYRTTQEQFYCQGVEISNFGPIPFIESDG